MSETYVEPSLMGGGDCFAHWHSEDRIPSQDTLHALQSLAKSVVKSADYVILPSDDIVQVSAVATVTLPLANNGREYTVVRTGTGLVTVASTSTNLICGAASVLLTTRWMSLTFKAVNGGWIII